MENNWLSQLKRLHALAQSGLAFSPDPFDKERYDQISSLTGQMLADLAAVPVSRIEELITPSQRRYVTPQIAVRGAVFQENRILLVKEKSDGKWTLPGGYADVGYSAVENIKKEIYEEANIRVEACQLISFRHKAKGEYDADIRDFYHATFLCHTPANSAAKGGLETSDARFFCQHQLPALSTGKTIVRDINDAYRFHQGLETQVIID